MEGKSDDFEGKNIDIDEENEEDKIDPLTLAPNLYDACKYNNTDKIKKYIEDGVPYTFVDPESGWMCLHWSSCHGNVQAVKALLKAGAAQEYLTASQNERNNMDDEERDPVVVNTPLHWAAFKGHTRTVWMLLQEGYSPNDSDNMGNTPVHLSASGGWDQILKILLDDGGNPHKLNKFRNTPLEVATTETGKKLLTEALSRPAPSKKQQEELHRKNLEDFLVIEQNLRQTMNDVQNSGTHMGLLEKVALLQKDMEMAEEMAVDSDLIEDAAEIVASLLLQEELRVQIERVQKAEPITTQTQYTNLVNPLSNLLAKAEERRLPASFIATAKFLINKSHGEYWLQSGLNHLKIDCATEEHVKEIDRLKEAIRKAEAADGEKELVKTGKAMHSKLTAELEISRALSVFPLTDVRVPIPDPPKDYYQPSDTGHILVDDNFPLPPPDTNEYVWIPSEALKLCRSAFERLNLSMQNGEENNANPEVLALGAAKVKENNEMLKKLEAKDEEDFAIAKAAAEKAAKKLKKKKKGGKKKK